MLSSFDSDMHFYISVTTSCLFSQVVELLIQKDADVNLNGSVHDRPLHMAASKGYLRISQLLVNGKGDSKAEGKSIFKL